MRRFTAMLFVGLVTLSACGDDPADFEVSLTLDEFSPGDIISLRADGENVEYVSRRTGEIYRQHLDGELGSDGNGGFVNPEPLVRIDVGTAGEQRGLLGHTVVGDRRFAAWTDPDTLDLVVGEVTSGGVDRIVWSGTGTRSKAIGGHLETRDGVIVLGIGSLTDWARDHGSGALVTLQPDGPPDQEPVVISDGWNNPFAFTIVDDGRIWVADNAPDGSDLPVDLRAPERIGTADGNGPTLLEPPPQRAPSAIVALPDGRYGVCGFLDDEMRAYAVDAEGTLERAGTIGRCLTGAAVLADGSIVTASVDDAGVPTLFLRPPE